MAVKPETAFKNKIHRLLNNRIHRQGNGGSYMTKNGTPDVYYEGNNGILFIEYKWMSRLPLSDIDLTDVNKKPCLSKLQQQWLKRAHLNNVQVGVAMGHYKDIYWLPGNTWMLPFNPNTVTCFTLTEFQHIIYGKVMKNE